MTEKCPYKSRYAAGEWITPVQYLAENMCARLARRDRVELSERFWVSGRWNKEFQRQTIHAAKLLKEYSIEAIIAALRTTRGKQVYSLGYRSFLVPIIKDEQERLDRKKVVAAFKCPDEPSPETEEQSRPPLASKPTLLSKLRGL